jgi:magnesium transporter
MENAIFGEEDEAMSSFHSSLPPGEFENLPLAPETPLGWPSVSAASSVDKKSQPPLVQNLVSKTMKAGQNVATRLKDSIAGSAHGPIRKSTKHSKSPSISTEQSDASSGKNTVGLSMLDDEWADLQGRTWIDMPFELQSVDAVLHTVCSMLMEESHEIDKETSATMELLLSAKNPDTMSRYDDVIRGIKNDISQMQARVQGFTRAMNLILDDDQDMALMNLSRLITHPERFIQPVPERILNEESDEPELILEAYLQQALSTANVLDLLKEELSTIEGLMNMKLDKVRNRLLYINTVVSILSLCVACGSLVGSILGMNLLNHMEDKENTFQQVCIGICLGMLVLLMLFVFLFWRAGTADPVYL